MSASWSRTTVVAVVATAVGLLLFGYHYLNFVTRGVFTPIYVPLIDEMTGSWGAAVLLMGPGLPLVRRIRKRDGSLAIPSHAAVLIGFSFLHTSWNAGTRQLIYTIFGLGHYDYGIMPTRYFMEFPMDVIVYALFVSLVTLIDHYRASRDREVKVVRLEGELNSLRLATLESQLQPHFLFNALNTVSSVMYEDLAAADSMLAALAELLRRTLRPSTGPEVPLHEELKTLDLYVAIMRARFTDRLTVDVDVADDVRWAAVPPLLLQPLVENAFKHGDPGPSAPVRVALRARRSDRDLLLEVEDNGPGIPDVSDAVLGNGGIGLGNTRRRLGHLYGDDHRLMLSNRASGGLTVSVRIPFHCIPPEAQS
jgi:two-component system, LytTR family, sensor kinase